MKINLFSYVFWPEFNLATELAEDLSKRGYKVSVQTSLPNYQNGSFDSNYSLFRGPYFEKRHEVDIYRYPVVPRKKSFVTLTLKYFTHILFGFFNLFRLPKADVNFFFATSPLLVILPVAFVKTFTRTPLVVWYQDLWPESFFAVTGLKPKGLISTALRFFVKFIYEKTDVMLIQSPYFEKNLKDFNYRGKTEVLYNWAPAVSAAGIKPAWIEELPREKFLVVFAGNIGKVQAVDRVLEAAKILQEKKSKAHFAFVGDGSFLPEALKIAKDKGLTNVNFYGRKPIEDMPHLFNQSEALLVSLKDDPIFNMVMPSKTQAYMSASKPIIAFMNGIGSEIVNSAKCGVVVPAEDSKKLADEISSLESLTLDQRNQLGKNGLDFFNSHFTKENALKKITGLLEDLI